MTLTTAEKIKEIEKILKEVDGFSHKFGAQIQRVVAEHKTEGGHLEYVYVEHFHIEIVGLSKLFQYLLNNEANRKYVFFATRSALEILLYLEFVLEKAKLGGNEVLNLLSTDLSQSALAINKAATPNEDHHIHKTLNDINTANKILNTGFDLKKIKAYNRPFPSIYKLCTDSKLSLKDANGADMYHIYVMYSESNHARLSNHHSISRDLELEICWTLEYFIEIYIRFYDQILNVGAFPCEFLSDLNLIKQSLTIKWF